LLFNTVKYLKIRQVVFQLLYRIIRIKSLRAYNFSKNTPEINYLSFSDFLGTPLFIDTNGNFNFLNQKIFFGEHIDWNFMDNGKLWNYNLHYANYILQEDIPVDKRVELLRSLHDQLNKSNKGLEPYPVSIRLINTIRFISRHKLYIQELQKNIEAEANFLSQRIEFHLLGNHVLENAFALLLAGAFFDNKQWINKGSILLNDQLEEQILPDGGHFELSPMYHQIILYRVLELIDWYSNWANKDIQLLKNYIHVANKMLAWLKNMTFNNGDIPLLNDSANNIAPTSNQLFEYAASLNLSNDYNIPLNESGYRKFSNINYECVVDVGKIAVDYQPGHGHADALSFVLYVKGQPVFVECGISTYQIGKRRSFERSTAAHNTLVYNNLNQSQIWDGFRVGERAKVKIEKDTHRQIIASHNGYKKLGGTHQREFLFDENVITNKSAVNGICMVYFHFHPSLPVSVKNNEIIIGQNIKMKLINALSCELENYNFATQYNLYSTGIVLKVKMQNSLQTIIYPKTLN
jgi:hypothetical protein